MCLSCKTSDVPSVKNATYQSFNEGTEKGYLVDFELTHDKMVPESVVINRLKHAVQPEEKNGLIYHLRILAESRVVLGFRPIVVESPNGILFKGDSTEVFKPVEFILKEN